MRPKKSFIHIEDPYELHRNLGDVLRRPNGQTLRRKFDEAASSVTAGLRLQLLPRTAVRALPADKDLQDVGALAVARVPFEAPDRGYKALVYGERVSVLYRGSDDNEDEKGWLFVQSTDMTEVGWVPESAVILTQRQGVDQRGADEQEESAAILIQKQGVDQRGADEQEESAASLIQSQGSRPALRRVKNRRLWQRLVLVG